MKIIGLCGGSGSGKGAVSEFFSKHGIPSIDTDAVYRELTVANSPLLQELSSFFGNDIINHDGSLNRKKLSEIVFSDKNKLKTLNSLTHKAILKESEKRALKLKEEGFAAVIFDAPLLFESEFDKKCDLIVAVTAPVSKRLERLLVRDTAPIEALKKRIASQLSDDFLRANSDYVIENDGTLDELAEKVDKIAKIILSEDI